MATDSSIPALSYSVEERTINFKLGAHADIVQSDEAVDLYGKFRGTSVDECITLLCGMAKSLRERDDSVASVIIDDIVSISSQYECLSDACPRYNTYTGKDSRVRAIFEVDIMIRLLEADRSDFFSVVAACDTNLYIDDMQVALIQKSEIALKMLYRASLLRDMVYAIPYSSNVLTRDVFSRLQTHIRPYELAYNALNLS
jgi:hypothetical protein